jgi:hypothetical protein
LQDIGQGFGFRPGSFDGAIRFGNALLFAWLHLTIQFTSISVLQWLLNAETSHPTSSPPHRLTRFFTTLHSALRNPSRAILQFYPTSDDQIQLITSIAQKAGFGGGVVVDYPNSKKARKVFLCLFVGGGGTQQQLPKGVEGEDDEHARFERRREKEKKRAISGKRKSVKDKDWILRKKEVSWMDIDHVCLLIMSLAVSPAREGKGSKRFKIHWPQAQGNLLVEFLAVLDDRWTFVMGYHTIIYVYSCLSQRIAQKGH